MPATHLNPMVCISDNRALEAITFYADVLGLKVLAVLHGDDVKEMAKFEMASSLDKVPAGKLICYSKLETAEGKSQICVYDDCGSEAYNSVRGNNVHIGIGHASHEEQEQVYEKLHQGGKIVLALHKTFWNSMYFIVEDKFGQVWQSDMPLAAPTTPSA
eukprot:gene3988-4618_t